MSHAGVAVQKHNGAPTETSRRAAIQKPFSIPTDTAECHTLWLDAYRKM